jgi:hypothetical protein
MGEFARQQLVAAVVAVVVALQLWVSSLLLLYTEEVEVGVPGLVVGGC